MIHSTITEARAAFGELLLQWDRLLWMLAHRYASRFGIESEEVHAEFCLALIKQWENYDPARGAFGTWVGWVCSRCAERLARARAKFVGTQIVFDGEECGFVGAATSAADSRAGAPDEVAAENERIALVRAAVDALPVPQRRVIHERFFSDDRDEMRPRLTALETAQLKAALATLREQLPLSRAAAELDC